MKKLRSFIYLDNYKMYSISSQLFEGLTEYIVQSEGSSKKEEESQKGPVGSGKVMADIIEKDSNQLEKKFLHDYSYNLFEDSLIKDNKVLELSASNIETEISKINDFSFVKISGNLIFNDLKIIEDTIKNFNKIGEALGYITHLAGAEKARSEIKAQLATITDREQKAKATALLNSKVDLKKILKEQGLNQDETYLKHLSYILDYGYNQQFEVQLPLRSSHDTFHLFSAQLQRENLKDKESSIMKKYSRETEKEFKLFGILTQKLTATAKENIFKEFKALQSKENQNMKEALMVMISALTGVENTFTGKLDFEYVVDPIALYIEI